MATKPKLINTSVGGYDVVITDPTFSLPGAPIIDGHVKIGELRKKITHYNLRRSLTTTEWFARTWDNKRLPDFGGYGTRRAALAALLREIGLEQS